MSYWKCLLIVLAIAAVFGALVIVFSWLEDIFGERVFVALTLIVVIAVFSLLLWAMMND